MMGRHMSPARLKESLRRLGFRSQSEASRFFGRGPQAVRHWIGRGGPPTSAAMLLYIMETLKIDRQEAESILKREGGDVPSKKEDAP